MADTLKYCLCMNVENLNNKLKDRGGVKEAGEERLKTCFNSVIKQVELTEQEEEASAKELHNIDRIFNLAKNN